MKLAWIRDRLAPEVPVRGCCRVLGVNPSGYHRFLKVPISRREARRRTLLAEISAEHA